MRYYQSMLHSLPVTSRRLSVVLASTLSLVLLPVLSAQQQPQNGASGEPAPEATVPYGPPPTDNLPPSPNSVVPPVLTIPAGTFVTVRLMGTLSSDINQPGDGFSATLEQPIVVDGWVVARRGQIAIGRVVSAEKAARVKGVSSMGVALSDLPLVDGRQLPVLSQLVQTSAGTSNGRDAVAVASTTGMGAAIGGAVDGGAGAGIGAAAGAAAGLAGVLLTPGRPTVMPSETLLTFRLQEPITVNTERSPVAYLPVNQQDYASAPAADGAAPGGAGVSARGRVSVCLSVSLCCLAVLGRLGILSCFVVHWLLRGGYGWGHGGYGWGHGGLHWDREPVRLTPMHVRE